MATLKSDLDDYLLQNESRRSYKFGLPSFSRPSFLSRSNDESPTSTSSTSTWFDNVQKEYFTLSRTQRFMGFGICMCFGLLCFILSFLYIPILLLQARKFALLFTLGSLFFIFSFSFLYGPWSHFKSLFSKERVLTTSLYGSTLIATLYCALHLQSTPLTIVCAVAQVLALLWIMVGYVPGGSSGMRFFDEALTCNVCDRSFSTRRQLSDHQQKKRHFGCSSCDSLFPSLMALEHHKEEFQHWSDSSYCSHSDSEESEGCQEDRHRLL
ncbi:Protein transport protein sft2 [Papilio xuthus]|uniref:Vesicle transport protein n=1 Tax=Papilio xuthus TaxID=66420 RepID=A0A194QLQ8_PAPXU|nr:Protein transport protein sft2 [Papilio xuthus]